MLIYELLFSWCILNQGRYSEIESGAAKMRQKTYSSWVWSFETKPYNIAKGYECPEERFNWIRLFYLIKKKMCFCSHANSNHNY